VNVNFRDKKNSFINVWNINKVLSLGYREIMTMLSAIG